MSIERHKLLITDLLNFPAKFNPIELSFFAASCTYECNLFWCLSFFCGNQIVHFCDTHVSLSMSCFSFKAVSVGASVNDHKNIFTSGRIVLCIKNLWIYNNNKSTVAIANICCENLIGFFANSLSNTWFLIVCL